MNTESLFPVQWIRRVFVVLFFAIICIPSIRMMFVKAEVIDTHEQRRLAEFPNIKKIKLRDMPLVVGNYIDDHFGFRDQLIELRGAINHFFHVSGVPAVLWGKDGWLFYISDGTDRDLQHNLILTSEQYTFLGATIAQRASALKAAHVLYLFVVAPNKSSVYPEYLRNGLGKGSEGSLLQDIQQYSLADPLAKERFLSLLPDLQAAKGGKFDLYYKTDTHWNLRGAYIGYRAIIDKLNSLEKGADSEGLSNAVPPFPLFNIPESDFTMNINLRYGDMDGMIGKNLPDHEVGPSFATFSTNQTSCKAFVSRQWQDLFDRGAGWRNPYCIYNKKAPSTKTLLVFADSFTENLCSYYSETFQRVICVYIEPTNDLMAEMVNRYHPDVVIEERVERYLGDEFQDAFLNAQTHPLDLSGGKSGVPANLDIGSFTNGGWSLATDAQQRAVLRQESSKAIILVSGTANSSTVESITRADDHVDNVVISGWAVSSLDQRPFDAILITVGSDIAALELPSIPRPDVAGQLANPQAIHSGFRLTLPFRMLHAGPIRFFGILGGKDFQSYHLEELRPGKSVLAEPINVPGLFEIVYRKGEVEVQAPGSGP